jgi:hypothetical protein
MITPIESVKSVSSYIELAPIIEAMRTNNDKRPKNSLPIDTYNTIQSNADTAAIAEVTLYNAHGILKSPNPNSLIGYA